MMVEQSKVHPGSDEAAEASTALLTMKYPLNGTVHAPGRVFMEGGCLQGATVEVLDRHDFRLGSAVVNGETWYYSRNWDEGRQIVRARQSVAGVPSDSTMLGFFDVDGALNGPRITYPKDGSRFYQGMILIQGACTAGAETVELLNHDFSLLGYATIDPAGLTWSFSQVWDKGVKHVKAREIVRGTPSGPSGQIEFVVQ
ncbi:hypothetical protein BOO88_25060 [Stutzerimonas stutzeri]|nr:hypothetical protein BOO89_21615 [Stutzerimonas stutzeri]AZO92013.1 hypothetical protein BOO88_25060 [Stutzerimonas stutzeri]